MTTTLRTPSDRLRAKILNDAAASAAAVKTRRAARTQREVVESPSSRNVSGDVDAAARTNGSSEQYAWNAVELPPTRTSSKTEAAELSVLAPPEKNKRRAGRFSQRIRNKLALSDRLSLLLGRSNKAETSEVCLVSPPQTSASRRVKRAEGARLSQRVRGKLARNRYTSTDEAASGYANEEDDAVMSADANDGRSNKKQSHHVDNSDTACISGDEEQTNVERYPFDDKKAASRALKDRSNVRKQQGRPAKNNRNRRNANDGRQKTRPQDGTRDVSGRNVKEQRNRKPATDLDNANKNTLMKARGRLGVLFPGGSRQ
eukprot:CAMPEP_0178491452 /NCGR_PEP_ID=MMETSP0696-20121128/11418_1 /TAXON_ID=265572 /ORGANISM="Extubocellulus spinifer, Strain CCMP396" /LENGTH=315 /DNA_ID=CAMNT_0020119323 /DNA_START=167 /DNA_END=1114 /DNA_ORIENTATION=-